MPIEIVIENQEELEIEERDRQRALRSNYLRQARSIIDSEKNGVRGLQDIRMYKIEYRNKDGTVESGPSRVSNTKSTRNSDAKFLVKTVSQFSYMENLAKRRQGVGLELQQLINDVKEEDLRENADLKKTMQTLDAEKEEFGNAMRGVWHLSHHSSQIKKRNGSGNSVDKVQT